MTTGVSCIVLVDGARAADGSPGDDPTAPTILSDLAVAWGRPDTMTQPSPDACTFNVWDPTGAGFGSTYRVGHRVDVEAHGDTYPDPTRDTFTNPGFEIAAVTWSATGATAARTGTRTHTGANALAVHPLTAGVPAGVYLAPAPFAPAGTNPDAWDAIPTTAVGQTWATTLSLWLPTGSSVTVRAALFSGPYADAGTPAGTPRTINGSGAWVTLTAEHTVQLDGAWVGLYLRFDPTGPAWDELAPALTWDTLDPTLSWDDTGTLYVDDAQVIAPAAGTSRGVLVFSGRITDLKSSWDGAPTLEVAAVGFTADLDNRKIGDDPWPVEPLADRAHRILELAGLPISIDIDTSIDQTLMTYRDVDTQGATALLRELAISVDGVLWPAVHESLGAYLRLEDPGLRTPLLELELVDGVIVLVQADPGTGFDLSACSILRDDVEWIQDVADVVTRVEVKWKVQGVDNDGLPKPTDAVERVIDPGLEATHGTRGVSVTTQLQAAADATTVADRILSRSSPDGWRVEGLALDDEDVDPGAAGVALVLDLLDGTSRIGAPLVLGDLPYWSPAGATASVYLEGGTYRYTGGRWVLELTASAAAGIGGSVAWDELDPTWAWDQWDPALTWNDLRGVAA
jgi:hypothetical protein